MLNSVAVFPSQCARNSVPVMAALTSSLVRAGVNIQENSMDSDAAVIWSVLWSGRMANNRAVYQHYRAQGKPVIIVEVGALRRGVTWKISLNNVTADGIYGHYDNLNWDRPKNLGIQLSSMSGSNVILIASQHSASQQLANIGSIETWIAQQVKALQRVTNKSIVIREHPRSPLRRYMIPSDVLYQTPKKIPDTYDDFDICYRYHAVVNYNSGPGIQAAIQGVRPIVDASSLAAPVGISIQDIDQEYTVDRAQWLVELCHTEYLLEEIEQGIWLKRLQNWL